MYSIGQLIKKYRQQKDMSQSELADEVCSRSYLSHIENGERIPSADVLGRLADNLQVPLDRFVDSYLRDSGFTVEECFRLSKKLSDRSLFDPAEEILKKGRQYSTADTGLEFVDRRHEKLYKDALGHLYACKGEHQDACKVFRQHLLLCRRRPAERFELARAHYLMGRSLLRCDDYEEAENHLQMAFTHVLSVDPEQSPVHSQKVVGLHEDTVHGFVQVLIRKRKFASARDILKMARLRWDELGILDEPHPLIILCNGIGYIGTGNLERAQEILEMLSRQPVSDDIYHYFSSIYLGKIFRASNKTSRALRHLSNAWDIYTEEQMWNARHAANEFARCHLQVNDLEKAESWLDIAESFDETGCHLIEPGDDLRARTLVIRSLVNRLRCGNETLDCLEKAQSLALTKEAEWGVALERIRCMVQRGTDDENLTKTLDQLREKLPGIFVL